MIDQAIDSILAAIANPTGCELEVLHSECDISQTADLLETAMKSAGACVLSRQSGPRPPSCQEPARERIVFCASSRSGFARGRDHFVFVPAIAAIIEEDESKFTSVRFQIVPRSAVSDNSPHLPQAA